MNDCRRTPNTRQVAQERKEYSVISFEIDLFHIFFKI